MPPLSDQDKIGPVIIIPELHTTHGNRSSGPRLGRLKSDAELLAEDKRKLLNKVTQCRRGEDRSEQTTVYIGSHREKPAVARLATIAINVLVINLVKLPALSFLPFTALPNLLLYEGNRSIHAVPL